MKFQRFPILVQEEVIRNLNYAAVFNMSFCSTKTANTIKLVTFKKARVFECILKEDGCTVSIENNCRSVEQMGVMCRGETNIKSPVEVKFGNLKQASEFHLLNPPYFQMHYDYNPNKSVEHSMVKHVHSLFRQNLPIRLVIYNHEGFGNVPLHQKIKEVHLKCTVTAQSMEYVMKHPDIHLLIIEGKLNVAPEVPKTPNVYITRAEEFARTVLQNFNGRTLFLGDAVCNNEDILEFINKWKNNSGYQNIEYVFIESKIAFDHDVLLAQIETTPWDEKTRPGIYKYRCPSFNCCPTHELNAENYRDIRRVDGKLASIMVGAESFHFCVWD